ncbi:MAG: hypothetical protein FJ280_31740 [Planctomycetes bacterium]|nr:hypothetical protein [Planctomycetota bacterium]
MTAHAAGTTMIAVLNVSLFLQTIYAQADRRVASPDGQTVIAIRLAPADGAARLTYEARYAGTPVLGPAPLGITRRDQAFVDGLKLVEAGAVQTIDETYTMLSGKRRLCRNHANEQTLVFQNPAGAKLELVVRAYNDGVAFRYRFPEQDSGNYVVTGEATGFRLPRDAKMWAWFRTG